MCLIHGNSQRAKIQPATARYAGEYNSELYSDFDIISTYSRPEAPEKQKKSADEIDIGFPGILETAILVFFWGVPILVCAILVDGIFSFFSISRVQLNPNNIFPLIIGGMVLILLKSLQGFYFILFGLTNFDRDQYVRWAFLVLVVYASEVLMTFDELIFAGAVIIGLVIIVQSLWVYSIGGNGWLWISFAAISFAIVFGVSSLFLELNDPFVSIIINEIYQSLLLLRMVGILIKDHDKKMANRSSSRSYRSYR